jgi:hypothetical protein
MDLQPGPSTGLEAPDRTRRVRRVLLGSSLVASPSLILLGELITPSVDWADNTEVIATAAAESGRWQAGALLGMLGIMLLVPAVIGAAELIRRRKPALALATVAFVSAGAMAVVAALGTVFTYSAARAADVSQIAAFVEETENLGGFAVLFPLFFAAPAGMLLLAYGLWRAGVTPVWVAGLLVLATLGTLADAGLIATLGWIGMTAALSYVAWRYLATGDRPLEAGAAAPVHGKVHHWFHRAA